MSETVGRGKITEAERIVAQCFGTTAGYAGLVQKIDAALAKERVLADEVVEASKAVIALSDRKVDEWDRLKAAIAAYHQSGLPSEALAKGE